MILNIFKPKNWTSFDVVAKVRGVLKVKKAGHAGTLDPLAEGVLVVLTGDDTKKQAKFMEMEKEYIAEIAFGAESPTYDLEMLIPPYSAKKVEGKPMYKLARQGVEMAEQRKTVTLSSIDVMEQKSRELNTDKGVVALPCVTLRIKCSSGTFVRSLAHELGEKLKMGGILISLVRSAVGEYRVENSVKIEDLVSQQSR
ncbi:MAG: tRNA pseudouridine synthase B [candidate division WWE3 bacterium GW2011_GWD1_42_70]|nr:MAG: tRNA pseudouridine synthase B [candidate division WWE3 bacterium GW2011_GWD1_42_70]